MTFARRNHLPTHFSECIPVVKRRTSVLFTITSGHFTYQTQLLVYDGIKESITPSSEISLTLIHFTVRFTKDLTEVYVYLTAVHIFPNIMEQSQNSKRHKG